MPLHRTWALVAPLLLVACVDNGSGEPVAATCEPMVKFSTPDGVSPQAENGTVVLPIDLSDCALDSTELWAWSSMGDIDLAVDVFQSDDGAGWVVVVPVADELEGDCDSSTITVALVDDRGEIVDQDRTHIAYALRR